MADRNTTAAVSEIDRGIPTRRRRGRPRKDSCGRVGKTPAGFPEFPDSRFDIIYADPPWDYKGQLQHAGPGSGDSGGAIRHYPTVTLEDLKQLPVWSIAARDCLLFLWATNPHLDQAIDLGKAWGFAWATVAFVWDKQKVNPGFYTLSQCELCLVFKRGKIPRPRGARNIRQLVSARRGQHSEKPFQVRERIEEMFPSQSRIELFSREKTDGWTAWGLESDGARAFGRQGQLAIAGVGSRRESGTLP